MRILDRYILRSVLSIFFGCLAVFVFLYIVADLFSRLDDILKQGVELKTLLQFYLGFLPRIFVWVAPIACLLATLYTFSKLNRDNEIIAMRAAGLSIPQITKTLILFGTIVSVFVFLVNDKFVPHYLSYAEKIKTQMDSGKRNKIKEPQVINDFFMYGAKNRLFSINRFSPNDNTLEGITILEHDDKQNVAKKIVANRGVFKDGLWRFYNTWTYNYDENGQIKEESQYRDEEIMTIPESPEEFLNQRQRPEFMNITQLDDYIWKLSKSGAKNAVRDLNVDLYVRFTEPFTSIIIIFLGIPFALMMKKRSGGVASLGVAIILGFLYHVLSAISIALGKGGMLAPFLAASLSHILAFTFSLYLLSNLP